MNHSYCTTKLIKKYPQSTFLTEYTGGLEVYIGRLEEYIQKTEE